MIWRILRNGQLKTELYMNTKKTKALLVMEERLQPTLRVETAILQLHLKLCHKYQQNIASQVTGFNLSFEAHIDELCTRN